MYARDGGSLCPPPGTGANHFGRLAASNNFRPGAGGTSGFAKTNPAHLCAWPATQSITFYIIIILIMNIKMFCAICIFHYRGSGGSATGRDHETDCNRMKKPRSVGGL